MTTAGYSESWPIRKVPLTLRKSEIGSSSLLDSDTIENFLLNKNQLRLLFSHNNSLGSIRGLHFQKQELNEWKFVYCVSGSVFDVLVDIRPTSKNFGKWTSYILKKSDEFGLIVPPGFAHGYQTLADDTLMSYLIGGSKSTNEVLALDPLGKEINVAWPLHDQILLEPKSHYLTLADIN